MDNLQIIYQQGIPFDGIPFGIKDGGGILFFFPLIFNYEGQDKKQKERHKQELKERTELAEYLLKALKSKPPTKEK